MSFQLREREEGEKEVVIERRSAIWVDAKFVRYMVVGGDRWKAVREEGGYLFLLGPW